MFYHGSNANLNVGDVLLPGASLGVCHYGEVSERSKFVYMTCATGFSMSDVDEWYPSNVRSAAEFAMYSALVWGSFAADDACQHGCPEGIFHLDLVRQGQDIQCINVYEVTPQGAVLSDGANDCGPEACKTTEAIVVKRFSGAEIWAKLTQ